MARARQRLSCVSVKSLCSGHRHVAAPATPPTVSVDVSLGRYRDVVTAISRRVASSSIAAHAMREARKIGSSVIDANSQSRVVFAGLGDHDTLGHKQFVTLHVSRRCRRHILVGRDCRPEAAVSRWGL